MSAKSPNSFIQQGYSRQGFSPLPDLESEMHGTGAGGRQSIDAGIPLEYVVTHHPSSDPYHNQYNSSPPHHPTSKDGLKQEYIYGASKAYGNESNAGIAEKSGLFHRHRGKRRVLKRRSEGKDLRAVKGNDETALTRMGRLYQRILNFSIVTRYIIYVFPLGSCLAIPIIVGATSAKKARIGGVSIVWLFTWIEIVWLSLWISKLMAKLLPKIFLFFMSAISAGVRKYAAIIRALEIPLSIVGWTTTSLATFVPLMLRNPDTLRRAREDPKVGEIKQWQTIIQRLLTAFLISSLIFLAERLIIQLITINYHRTQFDDKIRDSKRNVALLSLLYDASIKLFPAYCAEFREEDYVIDGILNLSLGKQNAMRAASGTATPMKFIHDVGRFGDKVTEAFGQVAQELTGKQLLNPTSAHSVVVEALEKKQSAEALATRLWMSFVEEGKDVLYKEDLIEILGAERISEAEECFAALDRDGNGDISLEEMIHMVNQIGQERRVIVSSMQDVDQAINVLNRLLTAIVFIMCVFILVAFLNENFVTTLATAGTALLSLSFVFAVTAQEVLGSCIFLFVKHPYDIGDRVDVSNEELTVDRISLLYTNFKRVANGKAVQIPNIVLNNLWVENVTRSRSMREFISVFVNFGTSFEDIKLLENELRRFVCAKDNARDFQQEVEVRVMNMAEMDKLELRVEMRYKGIWHSDAHRASRRSKFLCEVVRVLRQIPIYGPGGGDAPLGSESKPTYSVAVDDTWATQARKKFEEEKDKGRMFPQSEDEVDDADDANIDKKYNYNDAKDMDKSHGRMGEDEHNPFSSATNTSNIINSQSGNNDKMTDSSASWFDLAATLTPPGDYRHANTKENRALELLNHPSPTDDFTRDDALGARGPTYAQLHAGANLAAGPGFGRVEPALGSDAAAAASVAADGRPGAPSVPGTLGPSALTVHPVDQEHVRALMRRESSRGKRKRAVGAVGTMSGVGGVGGVGGFGGSSGGSGGGGRINEEDAEGEDGRAGRGGWELREQER